MVQMGDDVKDDDLVAAQALPDALTRGSLVFGDGATQTFTTEGHRTTYVENGRPTFGTWSVVGDGKFSSFWPPDYRATYVVRWIVEDGDPVGIRFTEIRNGTRFDGRYR